DGVPAVAVEVAGHRPDVGAPGLAERDGLDRAALVVEQAEGGVGAAVDPEGVAAVAVPVAGHRHLVAGDVGVDDVRQRRADLGAPAEGGRLRPVPADAVGPAVHGDLHPAPHVGEGVDRAGLGAGQLAAEVDLEVDVRGCRAGVAGAPDAGDRLASGHPLALGHEVGRVVGVVVGDARVAPQPHGAPAEALVGVPDLGDDAGLDGDQ